MDRTRVLIIHPDDRITFEPPIDYGPIALHHRASNAIVCHVPGHMWYHNQYNGQQYEPAQFYIFRILSQLVSDDTLKFKVEPVVNFYVKKQVTITVPKAR